MAVDPHEQLVGGVDGGVGSPAAGIVVGCDVKRGNVGGHPDSPPTQTDKFLGEVVLLEGTLKQGGDFKVKCGPKTVKCQVRELKEGINSETGEPIVKKWKG